MNPRSSTLALTVPLARGAALTAALAAACARPAAPALVAPDCPPIAAPQTITLPFAPERPFAAWLTPHHAVVADDHRVSDSAPALRALVIDAHRGEARPLTLPPLVEARRGSSNAHFAAVDGRLLVISYSTVGDEPITAHLVDPHTGAITPVDGAAAPTSGAFLTSPFRAAAGRGGYVHWPRSPGDAAAPRPGHVLDALRALWRPAPKDLVLSTGAHINVVGDGRVAVFGGRGGDGGPAGEGALLDLSTGDLRRFAHPRIATSMVAVDGLSLAAAFADAGRLRGYVIDLERGGAPFFERDVDISWRHPHLLHLRGDHLAYLAADALHLWRPSSGRWRALDLPFSPDAPSEIALTDLADGRWLIDGTDRGAFLLDPHAGTFCALALPSSLTLASATLTSPHLRLRIGGAAEVFAAPECPPGAPCAIEAPPRHEDPRAELVRLP